LERFDEAVARAKQALDADPDDFWPYLDYGSVLWQSGRPNEALLAYDQAIERDREHPYPHHYRASLLFELGRYKDGWEEWRTASDCYRKAIDKTEDPEEIADRAHYFGNVLAQVFNDYRAAEPYYRIATRRKNYDDATLRDVASAYQAWANADAPPPDIQTRLSPALQKAIVLSKRRLGKGNDFQVLLALADLHIDTQDWVAGRSCLEQAAQLCNDSRLKRAEVDRRQGLLELCAERYTDAVESFRKAICVRTGDLELRSNLGKALSHAKRFADAREEYGRVLRCAPGTIDALIGLARVCIELADEGETEYYQQAEQRLSEALRHGRDASTGSTRLQGTSLEDAHYLRGFARTKRWEAGAAPPLTLFGAWQDFSQCTRHPQALAARTKITAYWLQTTQESFLAWLGPFVMFCAAAALFVLVQRDFFFDGGGLIDDSLTYGTLTFGALAFMIAALYLPNLIKFKVAGIELEKTVANQVSPHRALVSAGPTSWRANSPASRPL